MSTKSLIKPILPPKISPKITAPVVTAPVVSKPVPIKPAPLVPCTTHVYLSAGTDTRTGLGAAYLRVSKYTGGKELGVTLFTDRLLVSRAIQKSDALLVRHLASLLLLECLCASRLAGAIETKAILEGLKAMLGSPWDHPVNISFLTARLSEHEASAAGVQLLLETPNRVVPWLAIPYQGPTNSGFWQWNAQLEKPAKKEAQSNDKTT
jgi:hypothetical protein